MLHMRWRCCSSFLQTAEQLEEAICWHHFQYRAFTSDIRALIPSPLRPHSLTGSASKQVHSSSPSTTIYSSSNLKPSAQAPQSLYQNSGPNLSVTANCHSLNILSATPCHIWETRLYSCSALILHLTASISHLTPSSKMYSWWWRTTVIWSRNSSPNTVNTSFGTSWPLMHMEIPAHVNPRSKSHGSVTSTVSLFNEVTSALSVHNCLYHNKCNQ